MMQRTTLHIVIGGEAGQGLVTVGELLARSLVRAGYAIAVTQSYMSRIRGGHNTFAIRAGVDGPIGSATDLIDVLVALNDETVALHRDAVAQAQGTILLDATSTLSDRGVRVPFKSLADRRYENVAALGVVAALLGLSEAVVASVVDAAFGRKDPGIATANREALAAGYVWATGEKTEVAQLAPAHAGATRLMVNGNDALALGALAAGVKFCAFYPMTPSTSIPLYLIKHADAMGVVVEQAEDEIAAVNMAIGASFSGSRSMVATSGGGFALMVEGVSLAAMTETPLVVVVGQRPAPATGLPTRTEQSDLEFILHAGHGEFPRALLTPGSVEECYALMRRAFDLADASQGPVFVLTDQYLADSFRDVAPFELSDAPPLSLPSQEVVTRPYQRYAFTASGLSPRLLPGAGTELVVADSDEHDEAGHLTEDLPLRARMVEKRLRKSTILWENVVAPEYDGGEAPELLLLSWGSTGGAVAEAATQLRASGDEVATLHFSQVWPLVGAQFLTHLQQARRVVCVEGNAFGQFARLLRRETGFAVHALISRYDGLPFTSDYILRRLRDA
jgi:2-oxoglutarate/2-oxoacid ferredoxin oxidoreductase subunit alpha